MKNIKTLFIALACLTLISACKKSDDPAPSSSLTQEAVVENYATIVHATYQDAYTQALVMREKARVFIDSPSESKLTDLKNAYLAARVPYEQSEAFRFYGGPIDNDTVGVEGLLNSWPLDEVYIDYVQGNSTSGIINDAATYPTIDKDLLRDLNTAGGEANVSCGYHAIEFLLWGQDLSSIGPGNRPYTDYVKTGGGTAANQDRRQLYLTAAIELVIDNLDQLIDAWAPNVASNYRAKTFVANPTHSIKLLLTGVGNFAKGELAGQRMTVAYNTQDQEEEHSCFSDDTHHDIVYGNQSIINVYTGRYVRINGEIISGASVADLISQNNAQLNKDMLLLLQDAQNKALLIRPPFDQEIVTPDGRVRVLNTINAIKAEADKLVEAAAAIGIVLIIS